MSKLWLLTKVLMKTNLLSGMSDTNNKKNKKRALSWIGIGLLLVFVLCSLGIPVVISIDSLLEVVPMQKIILSVILPLAGITTIIFSVFSVVNVFYMSKDIEYILPLPIKPKDIMLAKFLVSLINSYYILFMFIFPCLIGVGVGIDASVLYYIYMFLVFILLPVIPSVIVTFIILVITKFTGIIKNKDLFMYVSMALILVFAFGYNYIIQNVISVDVDNIGNTLQSLESSVLPYFKALFPFYNSGVTTLINYNNLNGLFAFITFLGSNIIALLLVYYLGDNLYLKTLTITRGSKKKKDKIEDVVEVKKKGTFYWLLKKEWLTIKRSPIFMLNIVIIVFLMPFILVVSFVFAFISEGMEFNQVLELEAVSKSLSNPFIYLIIMAVAVFFTSTSIAASTSISREGSNAWVMKVIPVSYFKQINVKVFFAVVLDMLGVIIVGIFPIIMFKIPFYYVISVFIPLLIIVVLLNYFNVFLDLKRPRIKWNEEAVAVKQNLNGLVSMLMTMAVCAIFGIIAIVFYMFDIKINVMLLALVISILSGVILTVVIYRFYKKNDKLLENVD